jgi:hypothetical protein
MISTPQILLAALLTAVAVFAAAENRAWPRAWSIVASAGSLVLIVAWRATCNVLRLNGDYLPAVSFGDTFCLLAGAAVPIVLTVAGRVPRDGRWVPVVAGAVAAFLANVIVL